ncbi:MAG: hypothetical protein R3E89_12510 [Thiolinea sp.]
MKCTGNTPQIPLELEALDSDPEAIGSDFQRYLSYHLGRFQGCSPVYLYQALSYTLRDRRYWAGAAPGPNTCSRVAG